MRGCGAYIHFYFTVYENETVDVRAESHPSRCILKDVGFQLLHEDLVIKDDDGVIMSLRNQNILKGL